ncbi:MAG: TIR domain-containing protein [bacterium]|nr:TIR domain-containing protein [bacterium]
MDYDLFISHASEDKADFVEPLVGPLQDRGLRVWYDSREITLGDDFRAKMDEGLASSRFGVVVISPSFRKYWPGAELSALFTQERILEEKRILPVVHAMTAKQVTRAWPLLAARAAAYSSEGVDVVAEKIAASVGQVGGLGGGAQFGGGPSRLYGVPGTRSVHFVGRDQELSQLRELLRRRGSVRIAASVEGLAGIGKTELALQLVHQLAGEGAFAGGIFWFDAESPDLTLTWGDVVADDLGIPEGSVVERSSQGVRQVSRLKVPVLIVLDNVTHWSGDDRPAPLPKGPHLRYLVTTRQRSLGGSQFQHLSVGFLEPDFARDLLTSVAGRDLAGTPGRDDLLAHLGGHALAVELAGAFLAEFPEATPASYLAELQAGVEVQQEVSDLVRYRRTVTQAFETIWKRLEEDTRGAWRLAACFEAEIVSLELSAAVGLDATRRRQLRRLHLIESDAEGRWRMHRLTREFGRRAGTEQELLDARTAFVTGCADFANQIDIATGFRIYLPNRFHLEAAFMEAPTVLSEDRWIAFLNCIGLALQSSAGLPAAGLGPFDESRPTLAKILVNLARVHENLGDLSAAHDLLEKAVACPLEDEDPSPWKVHMDFAAFYHRRGNLSAERGLLEQALESASDFYRPGWSPPWQHPSSHIRHHLVLVLKAQGDLPAARVLLGQELEWNLSAFPADDSRVVSSSSDLALVLNGLGETASAKSMIEVALRAVSGEPEDSHYRMKVERIAAQILDEAEAES